MSVSISVIELYILSYMHKAEKIWIVRIVPSCMHVDLLVNVASMLKVSPIVFLANHCPLPCQNCYFGWAYMKQGRMYKVLQEFTCDGGVITLFQLCMEPLWRMRCHWLPRCASPCPLLLSTCTLQNWCPQLSGGLCLRNRTLCRLHMALNISFEEESTTIGISEMVDD